MNWSLAVEKKVKNTADSVIWQLMMYVARVKMTGGTHLSWNGRKGQNPEEHQKTGEKWRGIPKARSLGWDSTQIHKKPLSFSYLKFFIYIPNASHNLLEILFHLNSKPTGARAVEMAAMIRMRKENYLSLPIALRRLPALPFKEHWVKRLASLFMVVLSHWYFCIFTSPVYWNNFFKVLHFGDSLPLPNWEPAYFSINFHLLLLKKKKSIAF